MEPQLPEHTGVALSAVGPGVAAAPVPAAAMVSAAAEVLAPPAGNQPAGQRKEVILGPHLHDHEHPKKKWELVYMPETQDAYYRKKNNPDMTSNIEGEALKKIIEEMQDGDSSDNESDDEGGEEDVDKSGADSGSNLAAGAAGLS